MEISDKIKALPNLPGVYMFKNDSAEVIYVGKAKNLKKRISQYFQSSKNHSPKTGVMVSKIAEIEHVIVGSEEDALLLENNLIKEHQPKYNILLKDGKTYPWICINKEIFPRISLTRNLKKDGSSYFGPYSSLYHAKALLEIINSVYKIRSCKLKLNSEDIIKGKFKVCLDYHIGKCYAPCVAEISEEEYMTQVSQISEILKGNTSKIIKEFDTQMKNHAHELEFEKAQEFKEKNEILKKHYRRSLIIGAESKNVDVFSLVFDNSDAFGNFLRLRNGCIIQSLSLEMKSRLEEAESAVLSFFMKQVYERVGGVSTLPKVIYAPFYPDDEYLKERVVIPLRGDNKSLLDLSRKNAAELRFEKLKHEEFVNPAEHTNRILEGVKKDLHLGVLPVHIECFDNSNTQGSHPVASCVVFKNGSPSKRDYRHFNIKTVEGPNDFASMEEVVSRRYARLLEEGESLPQLVIVDGGKGQVSSAFNALLPLGLIGKVHLIGIAKRLEEIIVPGEPIPLFLDKNSTTLKLIMSMRDEAHRFGITHHRKRRSKFQIASELDSIPGIGVKSQEKLFKKFKRISLIKSAEYAEIKDVIGKKGADALFLYLGKSPV